jgi:hypothetical protein
MEIAVVIPETFTGTRLLVELLLPSWPLLLSPQHCTVPLASSAQVWLEPVEIDVADVMEDTLTGVILLVMLLLPNCP